MQKACFVLTQNWELAVGDIEGLGRRGDEGGLRNMKMLTFCKDQRNPIFTSTETFLLLLHPCRDLNVSDPSLRHGDTQNSQVISLKLGVVWKRSESSHHQDYIISLKTAIIYTSTKEA